MSHEFTYMGHKNLKLNEHLNEIEKYIRDVGNGDEPCSHEDIDVLKSHLNKLKDTLLSFGSIV